MLEIERGGAQGDADARAQRGGRLAGAQFRQLDMRGHQRVERIEQNADRRRQAQPFPRDMRALQQQRARRLHLIGQRGLLPDHRAIDFRKVDRRIVEGGDRAQIGGEFAQTLARHQPPPAGVRHRRQDERDRDIGEAAADQHRLVAQRACEALRRQAEHEHHRHQRLHAERQSPASVAGHEAGEEGDDCDRRDQGVGDA